MVLRKSKVLITSAAMVLCFGQSVSVTAKEGMFTPDQLPEISKDLRKTGLKIKPSQLSDLTSFPMGAVVSLGGCSASFVSDKGLVVTNHHCARGSVQYNSTEENNYLEDGFLAASLKDELPASPGSRVYVTKHVTDVTDQVLAGVVDSLSGEERFKAIESNRKALLAECEKDAGHRCQVSSFFGGSQYKLNKRLEIKDVRIVYSPADSIGRYGGDIDNWLWPRHTGDFAFYRAYVSPEGNSAEFSKDNVPYKPEHVLKVSVKGVQEGDFVMVAGYPGSTSRYARLAEVNNVFGWEYPTWITLLKNWISTIEGASAEGSDARIKYEARLAGLNNYMKNLGGQIKGAERADLVGRRAQREDALNKWVATNADDKGFADAIAKLDKLSQETALAERKSFAYRNAKRPSLLSTARRVYRLSKEKQKPNAERESGYQERDMAFFKQGLQAIERRYDATVDKAEWLLFLQTYLDQPQEYRVVPLDKALGLDGITDADLLAEKLDTFYSETTLNNAETRLSLMDAKSEELEKSDDPFIKLAVAIYDEDIAQEKAAKGRAGRNTMLQSKYMQAIIAWQKAQGFTAYPDANSNLRVTYGNVMGGSPKDGMRYTPFTTLEGIVEKDTGEAPFNSPQSQLDLIKSADYGKYELKSLGSVPVNFMSDLDITGGNSGSATLNGKGELVGLVFDGTIESVNSDWDFNDDITRSIHVDSRYMLWVMEKIDGAKHIINEMTVVDR
jgi:hypothetical protein